MADTHAFERGACAVSLPPGAPKIRITAGMGTVHQKTWNLRRPATLIGSSTAAHIVLLEETVSRAHCIIVNTGREVLLKDLSSMNGTRCNGHSADLVALNDGDVLRLGDTTIQVAVQTMREGLEGTDAGSVYQDPLLLPEPAVLHTSGSCESRSVKRAVTIIGRRMGVAIQLDHQDVAPVHAVLMPIGRQLAVFDLCSATGTWVNDRRETLRVLDAGDRLKVGPFEMVVAKAAGDSALASLAAEAPDVGIDDHSLVSLRSELQTRARELDEREGQLEKQKAALETARVALDNDHRAVSQQALALWEAQAQLEVERTLLHQKYAASTGKPDSLPDLSRIGPVRETIRPGGVSAAPSFSAAWPVP